MGHLPLICRTKLFFRIHSFQLLPPNLSAVAPKQYSTKEKLRLIVAGSRNAVSPLSAASAVVSTWWDKWGGKSRGMWELVVFALAGYLQYSFISSNLILCVVNI